MPLSLTPEQRSLRARIGAFAQHAQHDTGATTASAHAAFQARFAQEVDPDGILPPDERARRAESARRAHFAKMALASVRKRTGQQWLSAEDVVTAEVPPASPPKRKRVMVLLPADDYEFLSAMAEQEDRVVDQQATFLLRKAIANLRAVAHSGDSAHT